MQPTRLLRWWRQEPCAIGVGLLRSILGGKAAPADLFFYSPRTGSGAVGVGPYFFKTPALSYVKVIKADADFVARAVAYGSSSMSRTEDLEKQEREKRWAQSVKLQKWATEMQAFGATLWYEDRE